jgi:hypothetical protein
MGRMREKAPSLQDQRTGYTPFYSYNPLHNREELHNLRVICFFLKETILFGKSHPRSSAAMRHSECTSRYHLAQIRIFLLEGAISSAD